MISYLQAKNIIEEMALVKKFNHKQLVNIEQAYGEIVATELFASHPIPPFDNSAMDGFAVIAAETIGASTTRPVKIPVAGFVAAGDVQAFKLASEKGTGSAIEIMTGAPMPKGGHDSVIKVEDVEVIRDAQGRAISISITREVARGENLRLKGTDFKFGQKIAEVGTKIGPEQMFAFATLGVTKVEIKKKPVIFLISTGSELVAPDEEVLGPGMIRNSSGPYLQSTLKASGFEVVSLGIVNDDPHHYREKLEMALSAGANIIISTGAVSVGKFDFVSQVLTEMNANIHFHKAAIRPGKPILFASLGQAAFFGMPGNPVSTAVGARFFLAPYLRTLMGFERENPVKAQLNEDCQTPSGLRCFYKARVSADQGSLKVKILRSQASYVVSSLLEANAWAELEESQGEINAGCLVNVYSLHHHLNCEGLI